MPKLLLIYVAFAITILDGTIRKAPTYVCTAFYASREV